ncbi:PREDICTED: beta-1,3-galactosyltransferase 6-like [Priapulus caudatus]|uniref:Hexosyltransferase n=1 Tax=Priapulus caudatus TaxID=37621 RepID=A0ABM1F3V0_PRICU|nr:PREDICTED: beta-1,3-galactosyltransferase 6-like [Priapulus caudatus]XP_014679122.1 PREDICTED: beta-1,3-galactosyltransferase 6-like [Priapulus caudatus]
MVRAVRLWGAFARRRKLIVCSLVSFLAGVAFAWFARRYGDLARPPRLTCLERELEGGGRSHLPSAHLLIIVMTAPAYLERRDVIRQTWLRLAGAGSNGVEHHFVIGTAGASAAERAALDREHDRHGDLLRLPLVNDSYGALTAKLLAALAWVDDHRNADFVLKVDDDTFVRLDALYAMLRDDYAGAGDLYLGFFDGRAPVRRRGKRWAEPSWFLCDYYLPYALGGGYVVGRDLVTFVARNRDALRAYASEDVSLGAWLAPALARRVHDPRFNTEYRSRGCFNAYLVTHKQSLTQMLDKYEELRTQGRMCRQEVRLRYSYIYNWNVPPSQCCMRNDTRVP